MNRYDDTTPATAHAFTRRHIGPGAGEIREMLDAVGYASLDELIDTAIPDTIRQRKPLAIGEARTEFEALAELRAMAAKNRVFRSYIGLGYHDTFTPPVIQRKILENPAWYTAYTPYQAEIAQGRLEALLNFQTAVIDLTGLPIANASLLDEATAGAEAMQLAQAVAPGDRNVFLVSELCHPQTIDVVRTRANARGIEVRVGDHDSFDFDDSVFGALVQDPATDGGIHDYSELCERAHAAGAVVAVATDLLALTLLTPPGEWGADIVVGNSQRLGVPLGYGGPHAAFLATRDEYRRQLPGRIIGLSRDSRGQPGLRMALQTREQHIRREKATSNICTAQVLLAVIASMYAVYHGPDGLRAIAGRVHRLAAALDAGLRALGFATGARPFFDTVRVDVGDAAERDAIVAAARDKEINLRALGEDAITIALDETVAAADLKSLLAVFSARAMTAAGSAVAGASAASGSAAAAAGPAGAGSGVEAASSSGGGSSAAKSSASGGSAARASRSGAAADGAGRRNGGAIGADVDALIDSAADTLPEPFARSTEFMTHPVFHRYRSETEMLRYIHRLESRDLSLTTSMIPLGSCTMKLNAAAEMQPVTWPEFARLHPFAPVEQARGYTELFNQLEAWLAEITGFDAVSLQPNAGSQGEFTGLLVIRAYHEARGESRRDVCLIPQSAHGTNPASAVMAGLKVVVVKSDADGNIDVEDLRLKAEQHAARLAALMVTYPSTHGIFEEGIRGICEIVHEHGGQVYMDGANMNAMVGLCRPGDIGADVCHLNLHKTFCIPHGGGGPGMGPIGVAKHLAPYLPGHPIIRTGGADAIGAVSAAPWGSPSILPISWAYIRMMGGGGLTEATKVAILNANYVAARLREHYPVLYTGRDGTVAHECIIDPRPLKQSAGVEATDIAKRLMDYGFHAPTVSFPVPGTLMIEPTESESKGELDRFCDALIGIRAEIREIERGVMDREDNPLKNAPHTADTVVSDAWDRPYSRERAAFPAPWTLEHKFWPAVGLVESAAGDRNLICACPPIEELAGV